MAIIINEQLFLKYDLQKKDKQALFLVKIIFKSPQDRTE